MNNFEKQIQVETKDQKKLSKQDIKDIDTINKFLTLHEAWNKEEDKETIITSLDQEVIKAWNNLLGHMEKRLWKIKNIEFVDASNNVFSIDTNFWFFRFSDIKNFNPPTWNEKYDIPKELDIYFKNNNPNAGSNWLKQWKEWRKDLSKINNNIQTFYANNKSTLEKDFWIKDIWELTPQQAIYFCTYFTISKLDYDYLQASINSDWTLDKKYFQNLSADEKETYKKNPSEFIKKAEEHSNAIDNASLNDLINKYWTWVCRNYADLMTWTFEAVKSLQKKRVNKLTNMYCSSTLSEADYGDAINNLIVDRHAWNTFFYVSKNNVESIIIDATRADATEKDQNTNLWNISYSDRFLFDVEEMEKMKLITKKEKIEKLEQYVNNLTWEKLTKNSTKAILYQIFDYYNIVWILTGDFKTADMKKAFTYWFMIEDFDSKNTLLKEDLFTLWQQYPNEYKEIRDQKIKPKIIEKVKEEIESSDWKICHLNDMWLENSEWPNILPLLENKNFVLIELNNNNFTEIPKELLTSPNLKYLYMNNNQLNKFPEGVSNSNLEQLSIYSNKFTTFPIWIYQLTKLQTLNISDNYIKSIPEEINTMTNLNNIVIDSNHLNNIPNNILQNNRITWLEQYKKKQQLEFAKYRIRKSSFENKEITIFNTTNQEANIHGIEINLSDLSLRKDDRMAVIEILDSYPKKFLLNIGNRINRIYYPDNKDDLLDIINKL